MTTRSLWGVLLVALVVALGWMGPSRAAEAPRPPAVHEQARVAPTQRHVTRAHTLRRHHRARVLKAHHRRHHRPARAHVATSLERSRSAGAMRPAQLTAPCASHEDPRTCTEVIEADHQLALANRQAVAAGVPLPILRVGFAEWSARRDEAAHRSREALLAVYGARLAFVREVVAQKPDWKAVYPPVPFEVASL